MSKHNHDLAKQAFQRNYDNNNEGKIEDSD
jgi:hypothetical protein